MSRQFRALFAAVLVAAACIAVVAPVAAQPPAQPPAQEEYVPVKSLPAAQETLPAAPLVMGAYAFVWVVLLVYLWSIWRRLTKVEHELGDLSRRLAEKQRRI